MSAERCISVQRSNGRPSESMSRHCTADMAAMCPSEKRATDGTGPRTAQKRPLRSNGKCWESQMIAGVKAAQRYQYAQFRMTSDRQYVVGLPSETVNCQARADETIPRIVATVKMTQPCTP